MGRLTIDLNGKSVKLPDRLRIYEPTYVSRYWMISQILASAGGPKPKILDVGGKEGLLKEFGFSPTILDLEPSSEPDFVLGNALAMPFKNQSFDISVSCDVLEHIHPADREQFIAEMMRVSHIAIICAPFNNPGASKAEIEVNNYYKSLNKSGHRWLQEHIDNGLPSERITATIIKKLGYNFKSARHFSLDVWPKILKAHLLHAAYGDHKNIADMAEKIYQKYYDTLCAYDFSRKSYRTFFVISKDDIRIKLPTAQKIAVRREEFTDYIENILFTTIQKQVISLRKSAQTQVNLQQKLYETSAKLRVADNELNAIKNSKSWRLLRKLAETGHLGK